MESRGKKVDEVHLPRMIPRWVMELAEKHGTEPSFIMAKKLTKTDVDRNQNRLLIHANFVKARLIPFLSDEENAAANLLDYGLKRKKELKKMKTVEAGDGVKEQPMGEAAKETKVKMVGREHGGLRVSVYVGTNKWRAYVMLSRWDASNGTILKGSEYTRYLAMWFGAKEGDEVELWGFRGEMGRACFALHKKESS